MGDVVVTVPKNFYYKGQQAEAAAETAWLLERNLIAEGQEYLTVDAGSFEWTTDNIKALRLARRQDADNLAEIVEDCQHVREHQWG